MKFTARHVTLEIELTQLDGVEKKLSVLPLNASAASALLDRLIQEDGDFDKSHEKNKPMYVALSEYYAAQLGAIYNVDPEYWTKNFDGSTIADVKRYVIDELLGVRKKA